MSKPVSKPKKHSKSKIVPVILCGGSGTRLWPLSRKENPKQFLRLMDENTLLQRTAKRAMDVLDIGGEEIVTITLRSLHDETARQLRELSPALTKHVLLEPQARNTAAATALAIHYVRDHFGKDAILWLLPSDHHIGDEDSLRAALECAQQVAEDDYMVTFGIEPTRPETGYGYIKKAKSLNANGAFHVGSFLEKPDQKKAEKFISSGAYLWNSGMHLFCAATGEKHFMQHAPQTFEVVKNAMRESSDPVSPSAMVYGSVKEEQFEHAVIEKADKIAVVPCDPQWTDIGNWESLWEIKDKDEFGNAFSGTVFCHDTRNSMILAENRLVTCVGMDDVIIIETEDSLLVADKSSNASVKTLVQKLQQMNRQETERASGSRHQWGVSRTVLSSTRMRLHEHVISPGQAYKGEIENGSSQWIVAEGGAKVSIEGSNREMRRDDTLIMPQNTAFKISNPHDEDLKIYELQYLKPARKVANKTSQRTPLRRDKKHAA